MNSCTFFIQPGSTIIKIHPQGWIESSIEIGHISVPIELKDFPWKGPKVCSKITLQYDPLCHANILNIAYIEVYIGTASTHILFPTGISHTSNITNTSDTSNVMKRRQPPPFTNSDIDTSSSDDQTPSNSSLSNSLFHSSRSTSMSLSSGPSPILLSCLKQCSTEDVKSNEQTSSYSSNTKKSVSQTQTCPSSPSILKLPSNHEHNDNTTDYDNNSNNYISSPPRLVRNRSRRLQCNNKTTVSNDVCNHHSKCCFCLIQ